VIVSASFWMDVFLAVLLVIAIAYFWRLDGRLKAVRSGRDEMMKATEELSQTITQAQQTLENLKAATAQAGVEVQAQMDAQRREQSVQPARDVETPSSQQTGLRRRMDY